MGESRIIERLRLELSEKQATVDALMEGFLAVDFPAVAGSRSTSSTAPLRRSSEAGDQGSSIAPDQRPNSDCGPQPDQQGDLRNNHHVEFANAIYDVIDVAKRKVTYASAGHHPPILARAGEEPRIMPNYGFALGVEVNLPDVIREHEFVYEPGTPLVLYTDGLIEFSHDVEEGEARLLSAARAAINAKAEYPARFIVDSVLLEEQRHPDDIAVLTIYLE